MSDKLSKAINDWWKRKELEQWVFGKLGKFNQDGTYTFDVPGRPTFVYVTMRSASGAQTTVAARNDAGVEHAPRLNVRMKFEYGNYVIYGKSGRQDLGSNPPSNPSGISPSNVALLIHSSTLDTTPLDADEVPGLDSSASFSLVRWTWTTIKAFLKTYFDTVYTFANIVTDHSITYTKIQNVSNTSRLLGRTSPGSGTVEEIVLGAFGATLINEGTAAATRGDLGLGNLAVLDNVDTGHILSDAVDNSKLANMAALTVKVNNLGISGDPIDMATAPGSDQVLREEGGNLSWGTVATGGIADFAITENKIDDAQVTLAKMANLAQSTVIGRAAGAGTGVPTALTAAQLTAIIETATLYLLLAGRSGGQTAKGGTGSGESLTLMSTANAGKGKILFGTSGYDESTNRLGILTQLPTKPIQVGAAATDMHSSGTRIALNNDASGAEMSVATAHASQRSGISIIRSLGDFTTPAAVTVDDSLGFVAWKGWDGAASQAPALIEGFVDDTVSSGHVPARLSFLTGSSGSDRVARLTIKNDGKIGIGTATPQGRLHTHDGTGGDMFVTKSAVAGTKIVIIPDGTGDVLAVITGLYSLQNSDGTVTGGLFTIAKSGSYSTSIGSTTWKFTVASNGEFSVIRTSGSDTATIAMHLVWR